jgi:hypothetical protein
LFSAVVAENGGSTCAGIQKAVVLKTLPLEEMVGCRTIYAGHPVEDEVTFNTDRHLPRLSQGVHMFRFWLNAGNVRYLSHKVIGRVKKSSIWPMDIFLETVK